MSRLGVGGDGWADWPEELPAMPQNAGQQIDLNLAPMAMQQDLNVAAPI